MLTWWWHQPLEVKIAGQCAPVLAGVKPSNMLVLENKHIRDVVRTLEGTGLSWRCLYAGSEKNIWLLYRKEALKKYVFQEEERMFLRENGYEEERLEQMLVRLGQRFRQYRRGKEAAQALCAACPPDVCMSTDCSQQEISFPHEMGVFLGYPMADVKGFIKYEGKNYLYSGYWKVYENVEERKQLFESYEQIRNVFIQEAEKGKNLWEITSEWQCITAC